jgi:hypothetical protein
MVSAELMPNVIRGSLTFSGLNNSRNRIGQVLAARIAATILVIITIIIDEHCQQHTSKNQVSARKDEIAIAVSQY